MYVSSRKRDTLQLWRRRTGARTRTTGWAHWRCVRPSGDQRVSWYGRLHECVRIGARSSCSELDGVHRRDAPPLVGDDERERCGTAWTHWRCAQPSEDQRGSWHGRPHGCARIGTCSSCSRLDVFHKRDAPPLLWATTDRSGSRRNGDISKACVSREINAWVGMVDHMNVHASVHAAVARGWTACVGAMQRRPRRA